MQPLTSEDPAEVGGYRLHGRLGAGGMGRVYMASTPAGRPVALKVVRPELGEDQVFRARFRQEIQAARRVHGLYTAQVLDADPAATPPWLVTAYVPGPSLQEAVTGHGPMPEAMAFRLVAGIAEALQAIHAAGVVHRDLKPSNVLLAPDGPRVIDFGIARALEATSLTRSGMMVGSPQFMAPEQIMDKPVTPAIDVFALGSLAAYAVLGRPPFGEGHTAAVSYRVLHQAPDLTGCPPQLRALIERCLRKDAAARPAPSEIVEFCRARAAGTLTAWPSPPYPATAATVAPQAPATAPQPPATASPAADGRPVPPRSMVSAVRLMYAGSALAAFSILTAVATTPALRALIRQRYPAAGYGALSTAATATLSVTIAGALISAGVWLVMARRTRRGRPGVRMVSTILFVIDSLTVLSTHTQGLLTPSTWIISVAEWAVGLAVIVFLWDRRSTAYLADLRQARQLATPQWRSARP
jgi:predicted Ser/Thr protein kinase/NADH:ubiquinone oxidoreductase subunit K